MTPRTHRSSKRFGERTLALLPAALVGALLTPAVAHASAARCGDWSAWRAFVARAMQADGRVFDASTPAQQSTSEGQSYGMFFALVANDRANFDRMLGWTRTNLAGGNFDETSVRLPAWQWGRRPDGSWGVLDANAASDADLWMAYSLLEAGRRADPDADLLVLALDPLQRLGEGGPVAVRQVGTLHELTQILDPRLDRRHLRREPGDLALELGDPAVLAVEPLDDVVVVGASDLARVAPEGHLSSPSSRDVCRTQRTNRARPWSIQPCMRRPSASIRCSGPTGQSSPH